jgi:twinkle protein
MPPLHLEPLLGIPEFDEMWGLVPTTTTMITGYPGHGKTSLVFKLLANTIARGINVTMGSFETVPKPVLERRLLAALVELPEYHAHLWTSKHSYDARRIMEDRLRLIANTPDEEHELDLETLLDLAEVSVARHGSKLLIIDPWNEIEHKRARDESETDYTGRALRALKRFAHRTSTAVWVVAHPRKPSTDGMPKHPPCLYDLAGSGHWNNKADYGLVIHRPDLTKNDIWADVVKVRMGLPGRVGRAPLSFDAPRSRYIINYGGDGE